MLFRSRRFVNDACAQAINEGVHSYRHIKALTQRLLDEALAALDAPASGAPRPSDLTQNHPLIQPADVYGDMFTHGAAHQAALPFNSPEDHP